MSRHQFRMINPSLTELLDDPTAKLLMRRDGVTRNDVVRLIEGMQTQWNATRERWHHCNHHNRDIPQR